MNLVSEDLVRRNGLLQKVSSAPFRLSGVTGVPLQTLGVLKRVNVLINGAYLKVDFVVTSKMNEDCILGQSFFEEHQIILNFNDKSMSNDSISACLQEKHSRDKNLYLKCDENYLISEIKVVTCQLIDEDGTKVERSGYYYLTPVENLQMLLDQGGPVPVPSDIPVYLDNGSTTLAVSCDEGAELWLPQGSRLGSVVPDVRSTNLIEADEAKVINQADGVKKQYAWTDDDPRRIKMIVEALGIPTNELMTESEKKEAAALIAEFPDVFALDRSELGCTNLVYHEIPLTSSVPVQASYRRVPFHLRADCIREIQELLDAGIIQHSTSNYNSPAIILKRKNKTRLILDFRLLNAISKRSYCSVPALNTLTAGCHGKKIFSNLDMKDGFLQVQILPEHRKFTAFSVPGCGFFEFARMSLGLCGGPSTFQNLLDRLLCNLEDPSIASAYIDDILSASEDVKGMIANLRIIFGRIQVSGLRFNPAKCALFQKKIKWLGSYISADGIEVDGEKTKAVLDMELPRTRRQVQKFIGAASWFRPHIKNFSEMVRGLTDTLKGEKFKLSEAAVQSIEEIKKALVSPSVLCFPSPHHEFVVMTDASAYCCGGTIGHFIDKTFRPVAFGSKILSETEQRYPSFKREFLAIKHFVNHWRYYLLNKHFTVYTDMKAITYEAFMKKSNCGVILRWIMELSSYHFTVKYREGRLMDLPDTLSRLPSTSDKLYSWWVKRCKPQIKDGLEEENHQVPGDSDDEEYTLSVIQHPDCYHFAKDCKRDVPQPSCEYDIEDLDLPSLFNCETTEDDAPPTLSQPLVATTETKATLSDADGLHIVKADKSLKPGVIFVAELKDHHKEPEHDKEDMLSVPQRRDEDCTTSYHTNHGDIQLHTSVITQEVEDTKDVYNLLPAAACLLTPCSDASPGSDSICTSPFRKENLEANNPPAESRNLSTSVCHLESDDLLETKSPEIHENSSQELLQIDCREDTQTLEEQDHTALRTGSFYKPLKAYNSTIILEEQLKDTDLMMVRDWLQGEGKPDANEDRSGYSYDLSHYWHLFEHLCFSEQGAICYKYFFSGSKKFRELLCVPSTLHEKIVEMHHDTDHCGHFGPVKTLHRVREKYYFPLMSKIIKTYCNTCETCFMNNHGYQRNAGAPLKLFTAHRPSQYVSTDLIGPINGPCRFRYILTIKDRFTKFVQLVPLMDATAPRIAKALMDNWIWKYGVPEKLLTDRANNLTGDVMMEVYKILSIYKIQTTSYHARGNGDCERANKDISIILKKLVADKPSSWPTKLSAVTFAINSAVNASTGYSPFRLQFGRELRTPGDLLFDTTTTEFYKSGHHLNKALYYDIRETFDIVRSNLHSSQKLQKATYDKKKRFHTTYKEDDLILVWKPLSPSVKDFRKFKNCYSGPWKIKKVISPWTYLVQHLKTNKETVCHFDTMKLIPANLRRKAFNRCTTDKDQEPEVMKDGAKVNPDEHDMVKLMFGTSTEATHPAPDILQDEQPKQDTSSHVAEQSPQEDGYQLRPRKHVVYSK